MKKVFLSYARKDLQSAIKLYEDLSTNPMLKVWFDQVDMLPGVNWRPAIRKAIRESDYFLALLSKMPCQSEGIVIPSLNKLLRGTNLQ